MRQAPFIAMLFCATGLMPLRLAADEGRAAPFAVAHRGLLMHAPENTLANFRACLELGLGFEFDVRRTKDGHLVCVHDTTVDRTTDGQGLVADLTWEEIKRLDAGGWFEARFQGERVPGVAEVMALIGQHRHKPLLVAVDIKGDDTALERDLMTLAKEHRVLDRLIFIGRAIDQADVRARLAQAGNAHAGCLANRPEEFEQALNADHSDWVYLRYVPDRADVERAHVRGKRVFLAGPVVAGQQPANWKRAAAASVDGILTDFPLELMQQLKQAQ